MDYLAIDYSPRLPNNHKRKGCVSHKQLFSKTLMQISELLTIFVHKISKFTIWFLQPVSHLLRSKRMTLLIYFYCFSPLPCSWTADGAVGIAALFLSILALVLSLATSLLLCLQKQGPELSALNTALKGWRNELACHQFKAIVWQNDLLSFYRFS